MISINNLTPPIVRRLGIVSAGLLTFGLVIGFAGFPSLLKHTITRNTQLRPGTDMREMFIKIPFALDFKVYIFNLTNPNEVQKGGKPHLQEIGPYFFEEWKEKYDVVDDETADTIEYDMKNTFVFRPDLSRPLTGNEIVTLPHLLLMSALISTKRENEGMLPLVSSGIDIVLEEPTHPFMTANVIDLLFAGVPLLCDPQENHLGAKAVCLKLENEGGFQRLDSNHLGFSIFGPKNGTSVGRFKAYRGVKQIKDVGRLISFNGDEELDVYDGAACNKIIGTDSTIFPPFLKKTDALWSFVPDLCRSLGATYYGKSSYKGIQTSRYSMIFPDLRADPEHTCFCHDEPDSCPPAGVIDLQICTEAPLMASKPHFLDADPVLLNAVDGVNPNRRNHDIFVHHDLFTGTPLSAAKRLQFSLDMEPVEEYSPMKDLPKVVVPMFWVEEGVSLNKTYVDMFKLLVRVKTANKKFRIFCVVGGLIGGGISLYFLITTKIEENQNAKIIKIQQIKPQ